MLNQNQAPIYEDWSSYEKNCTDVPGHKRGHQEPGISGTFREKCVGIDDVNSMKPLDNLGHPISIIREAERASGRKLVLLMPFGDWWDNFIRADHDSFLPVNR